MPGGIGFHPWFLKPVRVAIARGLRPPLEPRHRAREPVPGQRAVRSARARRAWPRASTRPGRTSTSRRSCSTGRTVGHPRDDDGRRRRADRRPSSSPRRSPGSRRSPSSGQTHAPTASAASPAASQAPWPSSLPGRPSSSRSSWRSSAPPQTRIRPPKPDTACPGCACTIGPMNRTALLAAIEDGRDAARRRARRPARRRPCSIGSTTYGPARTSSPTSRSGSDGSSTSSTASAPEGARRSGSRPTS